MEDVDLLLQKSYPWTEQILDSLKFQPLQGVTFKVLSNSWIVSTFTCASWRSWFKSIFSSYNTLPSFTCPPTPYQTLKVFSSPEQLNKMHGPCLGSDKSKPTIMQYFKDYKGNFISDYVLDNANKLLWVLISMIMVWWLHKKPRIFLQLTLK